MALRRNVAANFVSYGVAAFMGIAFIPVYLNYLGIEAYGLIGVFALMQTWLTLLDFGLTPALAREMARFTSDAHEPHVIWGLLRSVELAVAAVALAIAVVVWATAGWLATHWLEFDALPLDTVVMALGLIGVTVALRLLENVYRSSAIGLQRQVAAGAVTAGVATLRAIGAIAVIVWISPSINAFFLWQAAVSVLSVATFRIVLTRSLPRARRRITPSFEVLRSIRRFAGGTVLITVLGTLLSQADKLILSSILPLSAFAVYTIAYLVAGAVRVIAQPIDQAVYPRLTQFHQANDRPGLSNLYHVATQYNVVLMGSLAAFLAVFGREVLGIWTQDTRLATDAHPVLAVLAVGMLLNGLMSGPYYLQLAAGWTDLLVRTNLVMVVAFVPVVYALSVGLGLLGAAIAWVLINLAYLASVTWLMHRRLLPGEAKTWYLDDVARPVIAGGAAAVTLGIVIPSEGALLPAFLASGLFAIFIASGLAAKRVRSDLFRRLVVQIRAREPSR
jgi:O-antigen/teichoic acid export membrane protein